MRISQKSAVFQMRTKKVSPSASCKTGRKNELTGSNSLTQSKQILSLAGTPAAPPLGYFSWTLGQLARDPLYIMVVIWIFYPYFSNTVVGDPVYGQSLIGYLNSGVGLLLALTVPFLGAIADKNGRRKPWVAGTVVVMSLCACALWWILPGNGGLGISLGFCLLFVLAASFAYSEVFHNAMLPSLTPQDKAGLVSGVAFSLGNLGGLSLMLFVLLAFAMPGTQDWAFLPEQTLWGIDQSAHEHDRIVGPVAGIWLLIFTLPVLLLTPSENASGLSMREAMWQGTQDVLDTIRQLKHYSNVGLYLLARMFFNDGMVGVMVFGGVYASGTFGWDTTTLLIFGLCSSVAAMFGAFIGGILDDWMGSIRTLKMAVGVSIILLILLISIQPDQILYVVPVSTAAVWGSPYFSTIAEIAYFFTNHIFAVFFVTALSASRTLMARISPPERATQFFGLYGLSGSITAFLAPFLVATGTALFASQRAGMAMLVPLMLIGGVMLFWVREEQATVALSSRS